MQKASCICIYVDQSINQVGGASGRGKVSRHAHADSGVSFDCPIICSSSSFARIWHPDDSILPVVVRHSDLSQSELVELDRAG